jgi:hypothetical protein
MAMIARSLECWNRSCGLGYETLALALYDQPDLVEAMFEKIKEIYLP